MVSVLNTMDENKPRNVMGKVLNTENQKKILSVYKDKISQFTYFKDQETH